MTYITAAEGNLARAPKLEHDPETGRPYTYATVLCTERYQDEGGEWKDSTTREYSLRIGGKRAEHLVATAEREGNVTISFAGLVTERGWTSGDKSGVNRSVRVITWGYAPGRITVTRDTQAANAEPAVDDETPF